MIRLWLRASERARGLWFREPREVVASEWKAGSDGRLPGSLRGYTYDPNSAIDAGAVDTRHETRERIFIRHVSHNAVDTVHAATRQGGMTFGLFTFTHWVRVGAGKYPY